MDTKQTAQNPVDDQLPWYAVRLFTISQKGLEEYFSDRGVVLFIPKHYVDYVDKNGRRCRELRPVVRNLFFVKKDREESFFRLLFHEAPFKLSVIRKDKISRHYYEIPSRQMFEFRVMCNPEIMMRKFLSEEEALLKVGTPVEVTHGPLKGLTGKLVRQSKKYYLLKEVPGMAVMLKVTRWCCKPIE